MTMPMLACDTSVALPLLVQGHASHRRVTAWVAGRRLHLCGHAVAETYAVLTRLPSGLRATPADAARLLAARFEEALHPLAATTRDLPTLLAAAGLAGGATYDALVALAARDHGATLVTLDARARDTYEAVGVTVLLAS